MTETRQSSGERPSGQRQDRQHQTRQQQTLQRRTRQRQAIWRTLEGAGRPLGPSEILDRARVAVPRLGIATVYRAIRSLVDAGRLRTVEIPGSPDRYEVAGKEHHHHFHCRECDGVFEVEACLGDFATVTPHGFRLEGHEVTLFGVCPGCAS